MKKSIIRMLSLVLCLSMVLGMVPGGYAAEAAEETAAVTEETAAPTEETIPETEAPTEETAAATEEAESPCADGTHVWDEGIGSETLVTYTCTVCGETREENVVPEETEEVLDVAPAGEVASGTCGENLTWVLDDSGVLTISGTGAMSDYVYSVGSGPYNVPWFEMRATISSVVLSAGVTSIGNYAFYECSKLTSVTVPESVFSFGESAFSRCSSLTEIVIPGNVTRIGEDAFSRCSSLTSIVIPEGVTNIADGIFRMCSNLTNVTIPRGVTSIGEDAFASCSSLTNMTIPSNVTSIGAGAFSGCSKLSGVTIPKGVTSIGAATFYGCSSFTSITIPMGVTDIGGQAFWGCSGLINITIPTGVISIGAEAFRGCSSLMDVTLPSSVTGIGNFAFYGCSSLTSMIIPTGVTSLGWQAFEKCSNLASVTIPEGVTEIKYGTFQNCSSLTNVTLPASITDIDNSAFEGCSSLVNIDIPLGVTSIGTRAFYRCSSLADVAIPGSVTSIEDSTFSYCSSLNSVTLSKGLTNIGECAFTWCEKLTNVTIPMGVVCIGSDAFWGCNNLTSVAIPVSLTSIGESAFGGQNLIISDVFYSGTEENRANISIGPSNDSLNNATWHYNSTGPITVIDSGTCGENVTWTLDSNGTFTVTGQGRMDSYNALGSAPWYKYKDDILSVVIQHGVTHVGAYAFLDCENMTTIFLPESMERLLEGAFSVEEKVLDVYYPSTMERWNQIVFEMCNEWVKNGNIHFNYTGADSGGLPVGLPVNGTFNQLYQSTCDEILKMEVAYSDDHFKADSNQYNHELAKLSLQMVMAGGPVLGEGEKDRFIRNFYVNAGFDPEWYRSFKYDVPATNSDDTVGYSFDMKKLEGTDDYLLAVCIRSSGYGAEWASNFRVGSTGAWAHGFYDAAWFVKTAINVYLSDPVLQSAGIQKSNVRVWVSGFSRGGAVANILGSLLNSDNSFDREKVYVYTFATPTTVVDATRIANNVYNIVSDADAVPQVPFTGWGFYRYGVTKHLPSLSRHGGDFAMLRWNASQRFSDLTAGTGYRLGTQQEVYIKHLVDEYLLREIPSRSEYATTYQKYTVQIGETVMIGEKVDLGKLIRYLCLDGLDLVASRNQLVSFAYDINGHTPVVRAVVNILLRLAVNIDMAGIEDIIFDKDLDNNVDVNTLGMLMDVVKNGYDSNLLMQHWPEAYLAWMNAGPETAIFKNGGYVGYEAHCPVDMEVYDQDGTLVARIVDDIVDQSIENGIAAVTGPDGGKAVYFPADENYRVVITAREGDTTMSCNVTNYDEDGSIDSRSVFLDIPLTEEQTFTSDVAAGTSDHTIVTEDSVIIPDAVLDESSHRATTIDVIVTGNGSVSGAGAYTIGDMAVLSATTEEGNVFTGWYVDGELVSTNSEYTFPVREDMTVTAHFSKLEPASVPVYRLYNPFTLEHLFVSSEDEYELLGSAGWIQEGIAWNAPEDGDPVYRLYNAYTDGHFYTVTESEKDQCIADGWIYDGVVSYSAAPAAGRPIFRMFNPFEEKNYHHYTADESERDTLAELGWVYEGIAWYAAKN